MDLDVEGGGRVELPTWSDVVDEAEPGAAGFAVVRERRLVEFREVPGA